MSENVVPGTNIKTPTHDWRWPPNRVGKTNGPGACVQCGLMYWQWDRRSACSAPRKDERMNEPVKCKCTKIAELHTVDGKDDDDEGWYTLYYVCCSDPLCWDGPASRSEEEAVRAWNTVMATTPKNREEDRGCDLPYIKDPLEILDAQCERMEAEIIEHGGLHCARCDRLTALSDAHPWGWGPASPAICGVCLDKEIASATPESREEGGGDRSRQG